MSRTKHNRRRFRTSADWSLEPRQLLDTAIGAEMVSRTSNGETIRFEELDHGGSPFAIRVDPSKDLALGVRFTEGQTLDLTFTDPTQTYQSFTNKPRQVRVNIDDGQLSLTGLEPGFSGLKIQTADGSHERSLGLYVADAETGLIPDVEDDYVPIGAITRGDELGDDFLEDFNFQEQVAPLDYVYIYDQGGAKAPRDRNLSSLLTQSAQYGVVPVLVYYNIQATNAPGFVEGPTPAFQAINNYDTPETGDFYENYMLDYFNRLKETLTLIDDVSIPVQIGM